MSVKYPPEFRAFRGGNSRLAYTSFIGMHRRCSPEQEKWKENYYDRGIQVCSEWKDFVTFAKWAFANGIAAGLTLDRRDNDKGYSPDNCRFSTPKVQQNNRQKITPKRRALSVRLREKYKRPFIRLGTGDVFDTQAECSEVTGIPTENLSSALIRGVRARGYHFKWFDETVNKKEEPLLKAV